MEKSESLPEISKIIENIKKQYSSPQCSIHSQNQINYINVEKNSGNFFRVYCDICLMLEQQQYNHKPVEKESNTQIKKSVSVENLKQFLIQVTQSLQNNSDIFENSKSQNNPEQFTQNKNLTEQEQTINDNTLYSSNSDQKTDDNSEDSSDMLNSPNKNQNQSQINYCLKDKNNANNQILQQISQSQQKLQDLTTILQSFGQTIKQKDQQLEQIKQKIQIYNKTQQAQLIFKSSPQQFINQVKELLQKFIQENKSQNIQQKQVEENLQELKKILIFYNQNIMEKDDQKNGKENFKNFKLGFLGINDQIFTKNYENTVKKFGEQLNESISEIQKCTQLIFFQKKDIEFQYNPNLTALYQQQCEQDLKIPEKEQEQNIPSQSQQQTLNVVENQYLQKQKNQFMDDEILVLQQPQQIQNMKNQSQKANNINYRKQIIFEEEEEEEKNNQNQQQPNDYLEDKSFNLQQLNFGKNPNNLARRRGNISQQQQNAMINTLGQQFESSQVNPQQQQQSDQFPVMEKISQRQRFQEPLHIITPKKVHQNLDLQQQKKSDSNNYNGQNDNNLRRRKIQRNFQEDGDSSNNNELNSIKTVSLSEVVNNLQGENIPKTRKNLKKKQQQLQFNVQQKDPLMIPLISKSGDESDNKLNNKINNNIASHNTSMEENNQHSNNNSFSNSSDGDNYDTDSDFNNKNKYNNSLSSNKQSDNEDFGYNNNFGNSGSEPAANLECSRCTFINTGRTRKCQMCDSVL